ncbi:MAG: G5 domain-containing protein [Anaerolineales bacterium]
MKVKLTADEQTIDLELPAGSTTEQALNHAGVNLGPLDLVEPPVYTLLTDGASIRVVRVSEEFSIEEEIIPFERQIVQTESLPSEERLLTQSGENGIQEITYRQVFEDGIEVSKRAVKVVVTKDPIPEIVMVGIQTPYSPLVIPGRLVYLLGGNAWMMEGNSGNRRPLISSGDLDGHIFNLSTDGNWLLYTRRSDVEEEINTLWVAHIDGDQVENYDLGVANIVHFADWVPGSTSKVVFSTVEPRSTPPGWQANNDLNVLSFSESGWVSSWQDEPVLEANSGGVYGWWGTDFSWSPDGNTLAYARPDSVGLLDYETGIMTPTLDIVPYLTGEDWAWVPGISWGPDSNSIYTVSHAPPEDSKSFSVNAVPLAGGAPVAMVPETGMFSYPVTSPSRSLPSGEEAFVVAYLEARFPSQSDTSQYNLILMDRDGSNQRLLYPAQGEAGLEPQQVVWSPVPSGDEDNFYLSVIKEGNIWLIDASNGEAHQITGDGMTSRISWR